MNNTVEKNSTQTQLQLEQLLYTLRNRFENNTIRHKGIGWDQVVAKIEDSRDKLLSLYEMERTGGEPDVVGFDSDQNEYVFMDCSKETPVGRRNLCYDRDALEDRKTFKPENNAADMARAMGIELLNEEEYKALQRLGNFDTKTSSWLKTPTAIRKLGGAIFGDRRYDHVFIYHNGASSYYAVRGFRGVLKV